MVSCTRSHDRATCISYLENSAPSTLLKDSGFIHALTVLVNKSTPTERITLQNIVCQSPQEANQSPEKERKRKRQSTAKENATTSASRVPNKEIRPKPTSTVAESLPIDTGKLVHFTNNISNASFTNAPSSTGATFPTDAPSSTGATFPTDAPSSTGAPFPTDAHSSTGAPFPTDAHSSATSNHAMKCLLNAIEEELALEKNVEKPPSKDDSLYSGADGETIPQNILRTCRKLQRAGAYIEQANRFSTMLLSLSIVSEAQKTRCTYAEIEWSLAQKLDISQHTVQSKYQIGMKYLSVVARFGLGSLFLLGRRKQSAWRKASNDEIQTLLSTLEAKTEYVIRANDLNSSGQNIFEDALSRLARLDHEDANSIREIFNELTGSNIEPLLSTGASQLLVIPSSSSSSISHLAQHADADVSQASEAASSPAHRSAPSANVAPLNSDQTTGFTSNTIDETASAQDSAFHYTRTTFPHKTNRVTDPSWRDTASHFSGSNNGDIPDAEHGLSMAEPPGPLTPQSMHSTIQPSARAGTDGQLPESEEVAMDNAESLQMVERYDDVGDASWQPVSPNAFATPQGLGPGAAELPSLISNQCGTLFIADGAPYLNTADLYREIAPAE